MMCISMMLNIGKLLEAKARMVDLELIQLVEYKKLHKF